MSLEHVKSVEQMQQVFDEADCLFSFEKVNAEIERMAEEISQALSASNPIVLVVMNGGLMFAGHLLTHLRFPLQIDYLHATRYGNQTQGAQLTWRVQPSTKLAGRQVLIVDDILDEGKTLQEIIAYCERQGAAAVKTAVLADKQHTRKSYTLLKADFCGLHVVDRFVFGFGMDYQGYWRNAPGIFAVKGL
jgi:hypoxanthine phosphoribosyltransferase